MQSVPQIPWRRDWLLRQVRVPLLLLTLTAILFYTFAVVSFVPNYPFLSRWTDDGRMEVIEPYPDTAAEGLLAPGDRILEIDGWPVLRSPWRHLFSQDAPFHRYIIERNGTQQGLDLPALPMTWSEIRQRTTAGVVALGGWIVATLILLAASPQHKQAWQVGLVGLGLAVALAASEAALYNVPTAWLVSDALMPLVSVAFVQLALLPGGDTSLVGSRILAAGYLVAILISVASLFNMLVLLPQGTSFFAHTGILLDDLILLMVGIGLLLNPLTLLYTYWRASAPAHRRQILVILLFTCFAVLPLVFLSLIPRLLIGTPILPWEIGLALLLLIPAGYGYAIHRSNYLDLDLIVTRSLTGLGLILLFLSVYAALSIALALQPLLHLPSPLSTVLATSLSLGSLAVAGKRIEDGIHVVVYGSRVGYTEHIERYTERLARHPERQTLIGIFDDVVSLLGVREACLLLAEQTSLVRVAQTKLCSQEIVLNISELPETALVRASAQTHPLLDTHSWLEIVIPLYSDGQLVGALLLGPKLPDGFFHALDVRFLKQVGSALSMTVASIRLFEASRAMSRQLLCVRQQERVQLAAELHDDPLQRLSVVAGRLNHLANQQDEVESRRELTQQRQELLGVAKQIRIICANLHPPLLEQGLELLVRDVVESMRRDIEIMTTLHLDLPADFQPPSAVVMTVYHVLKEALNNVRKHAHASAVHVSLVANESLHLRVEDNGCGCDLGNASLSDLLRTYHFGIAGMHEWARLVQASLTLSTPPEGGTVVDLTVPLSAKGSHFATFMH
ncbi:MAG: hypothetical protein KF893_22850 [Caldilineaceae bacterium]|nr:hypothetical protein [Caldilineaceae bacterium]